MMNEEPGCVCESLHVKRAMNLTYVGVPMQARSEVVSDWHGKCKAQLAMVSRWLFGAPPQRCAVCGRTENKMFGRKQ